MAARGIVARLTGKETVASVGLRGGRWPFPQTVAAAAPSEPPIGGVRRPSTAPYEFRRAGPSTAPREFRSLSTAAAARPREGAPPPPPERKFASKRSPHSKLLRVCSDRSANPHFAAIEADLLRLRWRESMDALLEDWTRRDRHDDVLELERNVRGYVDKNLIDLTRMEQRSVREWEREVRTGERGEARPSVSLFDHLRFHHFPYERIVADVVNRAIAGEYAFSLHELKMIGREGEDGHKRSLVELHGRISLLSKAGKLLDAMARFDANQPAATTDDDDHDGEMTAERNDNNHGWSNHHTSCSNCYRSVLSGWFLLFRRLREANKRILSDARADAADILKATAKPTTHPEFEALVWAEKWIDFCTANDDRKEEGADGEECTERAGETLLLGGIVASDRPLLTGVVKILAMSDNGKRQAQSVELEKRLAELFTQERNM